MPRTARQSTPRKRAEATVENFIMTPAKKKAVKKANVEADAVHSEFMARKSKAINEELSIQSEVDSMALPVGQSAEQSKANLDNIGLRPLICISAHNGLFILVVSSVTSDDIEIIAPYIERPIPRLETVGAGAWLKKTVINSTAVYSAYMPWSGQPDSAVALGCVTAKKRKPIFSVNCISWSDFLLKEPNSAIGRYGKFLLPAFDAILPKNHPLRTAVSSTAPTPVANQTAAILQVTGCLDGVIDGLAQGWAFLPLKPQKQLPIEILADGVVVGQGVADHFRADLHENQIGDGRHHFKIPLSYEVFDGKTRAFKARIAQTDILLAGQFDQVMPRRDMVNVDPIPRTDALKMANQLAVDKGIHNVKAKTILLNTFLRAAILQETWALDDARASYEKIMQILGPSALLHCRIAETWLLDSNVDEAGKAYAAALECASDLVWAHVGMGNVAVLSKKYSDAENHFVRALELMPGNEMIGHRLDDVKRNLVDSSHLQKTLQTSESLGKLGGRIKKNRRVLDRVLSEQVFGTSTSDDETLAVADSDSIRAKHKRARGLLLELIEKIEPMLT